MTAAADIAHDTRHGMQVSHEPDIEPGIQHGREHVDVLIVGAGISGIGAACNLQEQRPGTTLAIVDALDSFGGTGTTAMVAAALGRVGITVDMSADYCRLASCRAHDPAQQAKVRDELFRKPDQPVEWQMTMFDGESP